MLSYSFRWIGVDGKERYEFLSETEMGSEKNFVKHIRFFEEPQMDFSSGMFIEIRERSGKKIPVGYVSPAIVYDEHRAAGENSSEFFPEWIRERQKQAGAIIPL